MYNVQMFIPDVKRYEMPKAFDSQTFCKKLIHQIDFDFSGGFDLGYYIKGSALPDSFSFENKEEAKKELSRIDGVAVFHLHTLQGDLFVYFEASEQQITLRGYDEPERFNDLCCYTEALLNIT